MRNAAQELRPILNQGQLAVADSVLEALQDKNHNAAKVFFLDGPGGTGKIFVYNYIIKEVITRGKHVSTCPWTGITATLLYKGKTVHSLFKLPVPVLDNSTCNVKSNSRHAEFLGQQKISLFSIKQV